MSILMMRMWLNPMVGIRTVDMVKLYFSKTKRNPGRDQSQNIEKELLAVIVARGIT